MKRECWLDYLRAYACILVAVGHLLMSFQDANLLPAGSAGPKFVNLIYCFHVYIFFFCSGYLFQKAKEPSRMKRPYLYQVEKAVNFLILYVVFTGVTYAIKVIFSSDVNSTVEHSFLDTLTTYPINQMWYLYAISAIYLVAYRIRSGKEVYIVCVFALLLRILVNVPAFVAVVPVPVKYLCQNMLWFAMGQVFAYKQMELSGIVSVLLAVLFFGLFAVRSAYGVSSDLLNGMLTLTGILASAGIIRCLTKNKEEVGSIWKYISKYMLQIYLLHTIFAAGIRIVLLKIGITDIWPHAILGLLASFALPILCAIIAERIGFLNVFFFPVKTIKRFRIK